MPLERRTPLKPGKGLSPGKGLTRKTPMSQGSKGLTRGGPLTRTTPMPRTPKPVERAPGEARARAQTPRKGARNTGPTADVRAIVHARDGGICVRCGAPANNLDHRRGRGSGGTHGEQSARINQPAWLLTLCGMGNTSGCHGWKESNRDREPERLGYKLTRNGLDRDAESVPVLTRAGWVLFDNDGGWKRCAPPPNDDARESLAA